MARLSDEAEAALAVDVARNHAANRLPVGAAAVGIAANLSDSPREIFHCSRQERCVLVFAAFVPAY